MEYTEEQKEAFKASVPRFAKDSPRLAELSGRIRPLVRVDGQLMYGADVEPFQSYPWKSPTEPCKEMFRVLAKKRVFVTWAYYGFFKPTAAECLAQMPEHVANECCAFEVTSEPETSSDFYADDETSLAFSACFHACEVTYFAEKDPAHD